MKRMFLAVMMVIASGTLALPEAEGQSSAMPSNAPTFFGSLGSYFTEFNTNQPIRHANGLEVWTAADYENGLNFADEVGIKKVFGSVSNASAFYAEATFRNAGVAGVLVDAKAGPGYAIFHYDTELSAGIDGGYSFDKSKPAVTLYVDVRKTTTANTFIGTRLFYDQVFGESAPRYPGIGITAGFLY